MTKEQLAATLTGREYTNEITKAEEKLAKEHRLVVAFGASDDLLELRGAIYDEVGACNGGRALIDKSGCLQPEVDDDDVEVLDKYGLMPIMNAREAEATEIEALWAPDDHPGCSWWIQTDAPHATFEVIEDGKPFCHGIVLDLKELE